MFCTHRGWPLGWRTVDRDFARRMRRAGVRVITFHESRHTCATIALKHGIPAKVVQERLGHSDIGVTLNIYSHVTPGSASARRRKWARSWCPTLRTRGVRSRPSIRSKSGRNAVRLQATAPSAIFRRGRCLRDSLLPSRNGWSGREDLNLRPPGPQQE
ncbi:MAG TPA: tyrosine-type recombinase/integrase [Nitrolancea sp.]|nr:tyrosine-type recombinase/integrase [Nitrolancea sp.]